MRGTSPSLGTATERQRSAPADLGAARAAVEQRSLQGWGLPGAPRWGAGGAAGWGLSLLLVPEQC